jgi:rubrerythrin
LLAEVNCTPGFTSAHNTRSFDKKLTASEFVRAIRFSVAAEYEAIQIYEQIMEAIDDEQAKAVINDIINEERLHAGQFLDILYRFAPDEKNNLRESISRKRAIQKKLTHMR